MTNLQKWRYYLQDLESPDIFIDLTFYWTISAVLQRRVYFGPWKEPLFPNVYFVFVANPGVGKSRAARISGNHILKTLYYTDNKKIDGATGEPILIPHLSFAADCTSPESLINQLCTAQRAYTRTDYSSGTPVKIPASQNALCLLLSEEMTTMFRENMELICSSLNQWYDAQDFTYKILSRGEENIRNVCVSMLGCTTPDNIKKLINKGILDQGLTARGLFAYAEKPRKLKLSFDLSGEKEKMFNDVKQHAKNLLKLEGQIKLSPEAEAWFTEYYESGKLQSEIQNKDRRVQHYSGRIKVHLIKLAILVHCGDNANPQDMIITLEELKTALAILREIEPTMHRALASEAKNPLFDIGLDIVEYLKTCKDYMASRTNLRLRFGEVLKMKELDECIDYLKMSGFVEESAKGATLMIELRKNKR